MKCFMDQRDLLFQFENKYSFLYGIEVNGVPIYTSLRDGVLKCLQNHTSSVVHVKEKKGRIYLRRIVDGFFKLYKCRNAKTLVFTSTMFRRDKGRNLAAEFLMDRYCQTVVCEWPSRNTQFDVAYLYDKYKEKYIPLDYCLIYSKIYRIVHRKEYNTLVEEQREKIKKLFALRKDYFSDEDCPAIEYLILEVPKTFADIYIGQKIFKTIFKNYKHIEYAIDFWGAGRENIIPVLPGKPKSIELQHGIITENHPGYIYPQFANKICKDFFSRKLLVYGKKTRDLLTQKSVFMKEQIEIIGNPRIIKCKELFDFGGKKRNIILFTSQPFEQDGAAEGYYETMLPILRRIQEILDSSEKWKEYHLVVKLHPRENNGIAKWYRERLGKCVVYDNSSQLFELLNQTFLHITVSSTTLYEAALFGVPSAVIGFNGIVDEKNYGFKIWTIQNEEDIFEILSRCNDEKTYKIYQGYLKNQTIKYM